MKREALSAVLGLAVAASAQGQDLKIGDSAPALSVAKWVKGDPVEAFAPGKAYVVEFWATWCGPCIASMPHLSEIQRHYGQEGLTVIGVTSEDPNNSLEAVEKMVAEKGDAMGYTVAWDEGRATSAAFMKAAGQRGIPCSFVVDGKGSLAYIGHPMFLDLVVPDVLAGDADPAAIKARVDEVGQQIGEAFNRDVEAAERLEKLDALLEKYPFLAGTIGERRFDLLLEAKRFADAWKLGAKMVDDAIAAKDAPKLNTVAWTIVDPEQSWAERDLDLALRAAQKAVDFTEAKDAAILDTLARAHAWKDDLGKAIELQKKAIEANVSKGLGESLQKALEEYERKLAEKAKRADG